MPLRVARKGWGGCTVCSSVKIPEAVLLSLAPNQGRFFTEAAIVSSVKHLNFRSRLRMFLRDFVLVILIRLPVFSMI